MTDNQWSEVEALVRYMVGQPAAAERMMPHLRQTVERMPRRCWPWDRHQVTSFVFGFSATAVAGALLAVMMGWAQ
jgi:hypothetical protein